MVLIMVGVEEIQYYIFENGFMSLFLTVLVAYGIYYNLKVRHIPKLISKQGKFTVFLKKSCPILTEFYSPTFWCFEGRLQTIVQTLVRRIHSMKSRRETLQAWDGGEVHLDWIDNEKDKRFDDGNRPTVLFLPGLVGSSNAGYIQYMMRQVLPLGYRCVVLNYRGLSGDTLKTPRTHCAACTRDLEFAVEHVNARLPLSPIIAVGYSLGGVILFNYAAKMGNTCPLVAIMTISSPWDPLKSADNLETPINYVLFNRTMLSNLLKLFVTHKDMFTSKLDIDTVLKSRTLREFDESFTARVFDYPDAVAYYEDSKLTPDKVKTVAVPTLCLAAADDPFIPDGSFPFNAVEESDNVALLLTQYGGHGGFLEGLFPCKKTNYNDRVFAEYVSAIFENLVVGHNDKDEDFGGASGTPKGRHVFL